MGGSTQPLKEGDAAPDFTLFSADGRVYTLSELYPARPVLLIWIRGTW